MDPNQNNTNSPQQPADPANAGPPIQQPAANPGAPVPVQSPDGAAPVYQQPIATQQPIADPGQGLIIFSYILWVIGLAPIGFLCALFGQNKTRKAGLKTSTASTVALVLNAVTSLFFIFVLPMLVITTYSGIQMKARDNERKNDAIALQTQLEAFFADKGYYPSLEDINDPTWRSTNMSTLSSYALIDPSSTQATLVSTPSKKQYSYASTDKSGSPCTAMNAKCEHYTLSVTFETTENGSHIYTKRDLN